MSKYAFSKMSLKDAYCIESFSVCDCRGGFTKIFEKDVYEKEGITFSLSESFYSVSIKGVVRGLHFQINHPQAKIVSVLSGSIWDVIVDLRKESPTYKKWEAVELSADNHRAVYVPKGFAHGFLSLDENTVMLYQCDGSYDAESDTGIRYDDPDIGVVWPIDLEEAICSERDLTLMSFKEFEKIAFNY